MTRYIFGVLLAVWLLVGCSGVESNEDHLARVTHTTIEGMGQKDTKIIHLYDGKVSLSYYYVDSDKFEVYLCDDKGRKLNQLINVTGSSHAESTFNIAKSGDYYFEITQGAGYWALVIDQK